MSGAARTVGAARAVHYRFVEHLATGGMAEIYAADAMGVAGVTRRVAVKRVLREHVDDPDFLRMFADEARLAVQLQHPNIVQTYDVLDVRGELYITMELLEGIGLIDLLALLDGPEPALTVAQSVYVVDRVLAGLHYAHERLDPHGDPLGIVHRDVSPHNVFLTLDGNVKLIDFGVAKVASRDDGENTEAGVVKGKVLYMAPEHCQGGSVDRRADIFSAGVLLYTLLTNRHPFKGRNPFDTMRRVIHDPVVPPSQLRPDLPEGFDALLLRALEKDPAARFQTARELQDALAAQIRAHDLYLTDSEFSRFIQDEMPTMDRGEDGDALPPDLVFGGTADPHSGQQPAPDASLAETAHATVERVFGVTLLKLRGVLDERFDPTRLVPHLRGVLFVDTADVEKITSYGIRGLLQLYDGAQADRVLHVRSSAAFIQQVSMVRRLLGGGTLLSFHLPYVDPVNGNAFSVLLDGDDAARLMSEGALPSVPCPGFPDREARFDEDPATYTCLAQAFTAQIDPELQAVVDGLAQAQRLRQVEKAVDAERTRIWIRRPLNADFRWRTVLRGLEGEVHLDLEDTPSWTEEGVEALIRALTAVADDLHVLTLSHAPSPLARRLVSTPTLHEKLGEATARVHASCAGCAVPRRVAVAIATLSTVREHTPVGTCPACGGELRSTEDLTGLLPKGTHPSPQAPAARSAAPLTNARSWPPLWAIAAALGLASVVIAVYVTLVL